jgi:hypothetical protein
MKSSKPRGGLAGQPRRLAILFMLVGVAVLCGVGVAIRRRSRTTPVGGGEAEGRQGTSAMVTLGDPVGDQLERRLGGFGLQALTARVLQRAGG